MGVPKFYRWISERYPCLSEVVKDYQIPDFDNLYLDMNGIIHNCSHPNDEDPHFRISEDDIFLNIFHYIEFLFRMIKPRKVFFMAVDGVAPRAKMNQQRGRRFRAAREAEAKEKEAIAKGEVLPTEDRFDSNCITPGTEFMTRLNTQLKYFVSMKISTDKIWHGVNVYLSGHETPGEGEHKIMDFIRYKRSQPDYDPDTKHCLYGLDADLIMLGLCSHEPHFSLLREEVKFGSKNQKKSFLPENITFHLLHLSLMREYLEHEFSPAKKDLPFPFDLEAIIDDWVLMGFLVGNDFIPNIPQMHIQNDALPILYSSYIEVLPTLGGYINEGGFLNLERFQKYLLKLGKIDREKFSDVLADLKYFEAKCTRPKRGATNEEDNGFLEVLGSDSDKLEMPNEVAIGKLLDLDTGDSYDTEEYLSEESDGMLDMEFSQHKRDYYMNKLDYENITGDVLKEQAYEYVRAIQWNLHYYYNGIASWSWYYPHHYAPYISDVTDFSEINLDFELGTPFLPYEQLLAVLPAASKKLLPLPFQSLMISENSPVKNYYPEDFKTDLNGKQQEWEAVVLIPFIDETLLLNSMNPLLNQLTNEEKKRNSHGPHLLFQYTPESLGPFISNRPSVFPDISFNHAMIEEIPKDGFLLPRNQILKGLCPGVRLEVYFPGFPTLRHVEHTAELKNEKVKVFQMVSRKENMMLTVKETDNESLEEVAQLIDKIVFVGWPHLTEAKVCAVSDGETSIMSRDGTPQILNNNQKQAFSKQCSNIKERQYERFGIVLKRIKILVHVNLLTGVRFSCKSDGKVVKDKMWSDSSTPIAYQVVVKDLAVEQPNIKNFSSIEELYPPESVCFIISYVNHGHEAHVIKKIQSQSQVQLQVKVFSPQEPDFSYVMSNERAFTTNSYYRGSLLAQRLGISSFMVSRLTGTFFVQINSAESMNPTKINIGLNLKFNKRNEEVFGYSKKQSDGIWLYSQKALDTMEQYIEKFPELFEAASYLLDQDVVHIDKLFPSTDGKEYIKKVKAWLDSLPYTTKERQQCGAVVLDLAVVEELEKILKDTEEWRRKKCSKIIELSPQDLYRPHSIHGSSAPDPKTTSRLYDRVVHVQEGASVPLGLRGTIVGIHKAEVESDTMVDVLFDEEFAGALISFSSTRRGYRLRPCNLINLSHGKRMLPSTTDKVVTLSRNNTTGVATSTSVANSLRNSDSRRQNRGNDVPSNSRLYSKALSGIIPAPNCGADLPVSSPKKAQMTVLSHKSEASKQQTKTRMAKLKEITSSTPPKPDELARSSSAAKNSEERSTPTNNPSVNQFNHSPDSPFVPRNAGWNNSFNFDSPSPDNVMGVQQSRSNSSSSSTKATPHSAPLDNEFMSIWDGLKQNVISSDIQPMTILSSKDVESKATTPGVYGKPVSVHELFQTARQAETLKNLPMPQPLPQPQLQPPISSTSSTSYCTQLLHLMLNSNKGVVSYSFASNGVNSIVATVTLPTGERFSSIQCSSNQMAAENAAEQALIYLSSPNNAWNILQNTGGACFPRPNLPPAFSSNVAPIRPPMPLHKSSPRHTTLQIGSFPPPISLAMAAATLPKIPNNLMGTRAPPPSGLCSIPDNFVQINEQRLKQEQQRMLEQAMMNSSTNFFYSPIAPLNTQNLMDGNIQFDQSQRSQQQSYGKTNAYQGNMMLQQQQQPLQGHGRGNNWAKGWQPTSPNKRKGNDAGPRGPNSRQFNSLQQKDMYQAQAKSSNKTFDQEQVVKSDKFDFIPSQVARKQAGNSSQTKPNGKSEENKLSMVKQMEDLTLAMAPDIVQSANIKNNESEPVISQPTRKSRLAVKFSKPQSS